MMARAVIHAHLAQGTAQEAAERVAASIAEDILR